MGKKVKKTKVAPTATVVSKAPAPVKDQTVSISLPAQKHDEPVKVDAPVPGPAPSLISGVESIPKPETSFFSSLPHTTTGVSGTGQSFSTEQDVSDVDSNPDRSDKASDEGEISDSEATEQNEEMNYRETCRLGPFLDGIISRTLNFLYQMGIGQTTRGRGNTQEKPAKYQ